MKTIAIAQQKGGAGKTMTAGNLAVALTQLHPHAHVRALDFDPQQSLAKWASCRDPDTSAPGLLSTLVRGLPVDQVRAADSAADAAGTDPDYLPIAGALLDTIRAEAPSICLIDTPPSFHALSVLAVAVADYVVLPVMAAARDLDAADGTVSALRASFEAENRPMPPILYLPSRMRRRTRLSTGFIEAMHDRGTVLAMIEDRVENAEAELYGLSTLEYRPTSLAAAEWRIVAKQLSRYV